MRYLVVFNLLLAVPLALVAGCGGSSSGRANVSPGVMPDGGTYNGVYTSVQYGEMNLCQTGTQVIGDFRKNERYGRIQGTVQGNLLRFEWTEDRELVIGRPTRTRGRGYFQYREGEDGDHYILGEWGHDDSETGGGPWRAVKMRGNRRPNCNFATDDTSGGEGYDDSDYGDSDYDDQDSYDDEGTYEDSPPPTSDDALEGLDDL